MERKNFEYYFIGTVLNIVDKKELNIFRNDFIDFLNIPEKDKYDNIINYFLIIFLIIAVSVIFKYIFIN